MKIIVKTNVKIIVTAFFSMVCLFASPAFALDIKLAKEQGLIGERKDGYLGYVVDNPNTEVMNLVKTINNKRKAKFQQTATKTGATLDQVQLRFYERAIEATKPNHFYQDKGGNWIKK